MIMGKFSQVGGRPRERFAGRTTISVAVPGRSPSPGFSPTWARRRRQCRGWNSADGRPPRYYSPEIFFFELKIGSIVHAVALWTAERNSLALLLGMDLDQKAMDAIRRWRFEPATDGAPVAVKISLEVPGGRTNATGPSIW